MQRIGSEYFGFSFRILSAIEFIAVCLRLIGAVAVFCFQNALAQPLCDAPRPILQAERTVERLGVVLERAMVGNMDRLARNWQNEDTRISYRINLELPPQCSQQNHRVLWVYRIGAPYRVTVDGMPLESIEPFAAQSTSTNTIYNGRVPALFALPPGAKQLNITLATIPYVPSGLMDLQTGSRSSMAALFAFHYTGILQVNELSSAVIFAIAVLGLTIWLARRKERAVLLFAAACLAWSLRGIFYQQFVLGWPPLLMEQLNPLFAMLTGVCLIASLMSTLKIMTRRRAIVLFALALCTIAGLALAHLLGHGARPVRLAVFLVAMLMLAALPLLVWRYGQHLGKSYRGLLAFGFTMALAGAIHDIMLVTGPIQPNHWSFIAPGFTVLLFCYAAASAQFLASNLNRAENANEELERAIEARTGQLDSTYKLLGERDRDAARIHERERIVREMHDGLGAQLMTALRGMERGALGKEQIAQSLQDGLDELRLLMDSTDNTQPLQTALANWRNRWDGRLAATGLSLRWALDDELENIELPGDTVLQIMRVLQEAGANIVKHAQAREVAVSALVQSEADGGRGLVLEITDDGIGLPAADSSRPGRGIRNMRQRARLIGATLELMPRPNGLQGTVVRLHLPLPPLTSPIA